MSENRHPSLYLGAQTEVLKALTIFLDLFLAVLTWVMHFSCSSRPCLGFGVNGLARR